MICFGHFLHSRFTSSFSGALFFRLALLCGLIVLPEGGIQAQQEPAAKGFLIMEFLASNSRGLIDEDGERSDWIEIYNDGMETGNLEGWGLTDEIGNLNKWVFPNRRLAPGEYLVIFASGKDRRRPGANLHTNFKLKTKGDYLAIVRPGGKRIHQEFTPKYPKQIDDVSFGILKHDREKRFFEAPSPGRNNGAALNGLVDSIEFSHKRGFFEESFDLVLELGEPGAVIHYTMDGTRPDSDSPLYRQPIRIGSTTVLRATGFKPNFKPSLCKTHTYIFLHDVIRQSADGVPPEGFHLSWGANRVDYGMDPNVVEDPRYQDQIIQGLKSIPSFSIVMDLDDLFGDYRGIYANAQNDGRDWERACSLELLPGQDQKDFQEDCGIRIRGGFSRSSSNPKHAFRFFFRKEYGKTKLAYPLFGEAGADRFDNLDLRTSQNYSWSFSADRENGVFIRDQFSRDTQLDMGHVSARGKYYHLYINGQYWGLYNSCERPEASFAASYFEGEKENYDVIKIGNRDGGWGYVATATDGNMEAWERLWSIAKGGLEGDAPYQRLLGNNPDGKRNPAYDVLLNPDNLIDYMLVIFYTGNIDAPISAFMGNNGINNWYGFRNRNGKEGFRFVAWDSEHTLLVDEGGGGRLYVNRLGPFPAGDEFDQSNPQWLWQQCLDNEGFRVRVADRVRKHFFNGGALTQEACRKRLNRRVNEIELAVIGESARWGDVRGGFRGGRRGGSGSTKPANRDDHWRPAVDRILNDFFPYRSSIVLDQLWEHGLLPDINVPEFNRLGGIAKIGDSVNLTAEDGTIYYTLDGTDPRLMGGSLNPSAIGYNQAIKIKGNLTVKTRVLLNSEWSTLNEVTFKMDPAK